MGTTQRRQREVARRRASILAAARTVFWRRGYAGATMPLIAEQAELAPGTLYLYFPGKDALYIELLLAGYDLLADRLRSAAGKPGAPAHQADRLIETFFAFARESPEYFEIMFFVVQRETGHGFGENFAPGQLEQLAAKEKLCRLIAADVLAGAHFGPAKRRDHVIDAIWGMLAGVVFYFRNDETFDAVAAEARRLLLSAVFGGPKRPARPARKGTKR